MLKIAVKYGMRENRLNGVVPPRIVGEKCRDAVKREMWYVEANLYMCTLRKLAILEYCNISQGVPFVSPNVVNLRGVIRRNHIAIFYHLAANRFWTYEMAQIDRRTAKDINLFSSGDRQRDSGGTARFQFQGASDWPTWTWTFRCSSAYLRLLAFRHFLVPSFFNGTLATSAFKFDWIISLNVDHICEYIMESRCLSPVSMSRSRNICNRVFYLSNPSKMGPYKKWLQKVRRRNHIAHIGRNRLQNGSHLWHWQDWPRGRCGW